MACDGCEERDERIRQLEAELYNRDWFPPSELGFTATEMSIVQAMCRAGERYLSRAFLLELTRNQASRVSLEDVEAKIVDVRLSHIRSKLRVYDLQIETKYGLGWRFTAPTLNRLLNWNTQVEQAA